MHSFQHILQTKLTDKVSAVPATDEKTIQFLFEKVVTEYYGVKGRSNVVPMEFKDGVLILGVYKSLWQAEVTLTKEDLLASLNQKIGEALVKTIHIKRK